MANIAVEQITQASDPGLQKIGLRVAKIAELAAEKVAAAFADPVAFPLSTDPKSIERILQSRFAELPGGAKREAAKRKAADKAMARINAPTAERVARYGDLAALNLRTAVAIDMQAAALQMPAEIQLSPELERSLKLPRPTLLPTLKDRHAANMVRLRIHTVKCVDETDGFLGSEAGEDEIDLGGTAVDETGDTEQLTAFRVRSDFEDGKVQSYSPPREFVSFDISEGTDFPKSYFVTLVLAEIDMGGLPDFVSKLLDWAKEKVTKAIVELVGGLIGLSGGPIGAAIGMAVAAAVNAVFDFFKDIWEDDIFKPITVRATITTGLNDRFAGGLLDSPDQVINYRGYGGEYEVTFDWELLVESISPPGPPSPPVVRASVHSGNFLQSTFGKQGNFELVVPQGGNLVYYFRDNDAPDFPWRRSGAVISGVGGDVPGLRPAPVAVSMIQSNFNQPGNLEAIVRMRAPGGGREGDSLAFYFFDSASLKWNGPFDVAVDGTAITGVTGNPAFVQSTFGKQGNFELVVPQGGNLVHYFRDNDAPDFPWRRSGAVISGVGGDVPGLRPAPVAVSMIQSNFNQPGNLEAIVRMRAPGGGREGDSLAFYFFDSASLKWNGPFELTIEGQPITEDSA